MTDTIRIIAVVVDTQCLTMYRDTGEKLVIPQGDARIQKLVDKLVPAIEANKFCDLDMDEISQTSHYNKVQESSNGFVQFFRTFKSTMEALITQFAELDQEPAPTVVAPRVVGEVPQSKAQSAVAEIMANATPVTSNEFHTPMGDHETVVAVLDTGEMVPGMEKLDTQLKGVAATEGSSVGMENFLRRVASVPRAHSVQDLLTFMQKGELPLADDGSVLVYKRLKSTSEAGVFADCHTGRVKQRVGSHVFMDEKLVDPDRTQDCSNGLHVARRDYLNSFSGNVVVLAKLAPEDVIAVPHRDARKLRAKGYHIIAQLSKEDADLVCKDKPMSDTVLLGNAVVGNHVGILETVQITGHNGCGVVITQVAEATKVVLNQESKAESLDTLPECAPEGKADPVDAAKLAKKVISDRKSARQIATEEKMGKIMTAKSQKAQIEAAQDLMAYKKAAKISWEKLGITEKEALRVANIANGQSDVKAAATKATTQYKQPPATTKKDTWAPSRVVNGVDTGTGTPKQRIRALLDKLTSVGAAQAVLSIKKQAKKSWEALGVTDAEVQKVTKLAGK